MTEPSKTSSSNRHSLLCLRIFTTTPPGLRHTPSPAGLKPLVTSSPSLSGITSGGGFAVGHTTGLSGAPGRIAELRLLQGQPEQLRPFVLFEKGARDPALVLGAPDAVRAVSLGLDGGERGRGQCLAAEGRDGTALWNARSQVDPPAGLAPDRLELQLLDAHRRQSWTSGSSGRRPAAVFSSSRVSCRPPEA